MFRSWGEFRSCATEVFHLFADAPRPARPGSTSAATEAAELSRTGLQCAFYVLLGRYPSPTLLSDCFTPTPTITISPSPRSPLPSSCAKVDDCTPHRRPRGDESGHMRISLRTYLRFITLCAEQEGPGLVAATLPEGEYDGGTEVAGVIPHAQVAQVVTLQGWRQFESVAGKKGFISRDDMASLPMQNPFQDVDAVLGAAHLSGASPPCEDRRLSIASVENAAASRRRQQAVAEHVFWILDRDRDGKVCFEDVKPYLLGST